MYTYPNLNLNKSNIYTINTPTSHRNNIAITNNNDMSQQKTNTLKILIPMYSIYGIRRRYISTIYLRSKTSIKLNILTIDKNNNIHSNYNIRILNS
jgi:hypothetical protein